MRGESEQRRPVIGQGYTSNYWGNRNYNIRVWEPTKTISYLRNRNLRPAFEDRLTDTTTGFNV